MIKNLQSEGLPIQYINQMQQTIILSKLNLLVPKAFAPSIKHNPFYHYTGSCNSPNKSPHRKLSISLCEKKHLKSLCQKIDTIKKESSCSFTKYAHKDKHFESITDLSFQLKIDNLTLCNANKLSSSYGISGISINQQKGRYKKYSPSKKMMTEPIKNPQNQRLNDSLLTNYKQYQKKQKQKYLKSLGSRVLYEKYRIGMKNKSTDEVFKSNNQIEELKRRLFPVSKIKTQGLNITTIYQDLFLHQRNLNRNPNFTPNRNPNLTPNCNPNRTPNRNLNQNPNQNPNQNQNHCRKKSKFMQRKMQIKNFDNLNNPSRLSPWSNNRCKDRQKQYDQK